MDTLYVIILSSVPFGMESYLDACDDLISIPLCYGSSVPFGMESYLDNT